MKFLNIVLILMMINLAIPLVYNTGWIPIPETTIDGEGYYSLELHSQEQIDLTTLNDDNRFKNCDADDQTQSFACKVQKYSDNKFYSAKGIEPSDLASTSGTGDFIKGLKIMSDVFLQGTVLIYPTLKEFTPEELHPYLFFWVIPIQFMYLVGLFQIISNRNTGDLQ